MAVTPWQRVVEARSDLRSALAHVEAVTEELDLSDAMVYRLRSALSWLDDFEFDVREFVEWRSLR